MNVFEPFTTENTSRSSEQGTGPGLAIKKKIPDAHNAEIGIDDIEGYTKAFVVRFIK